MTEVPLYDRFSQDYDRFVNWKNRLRYEWPFLAGRLEAAGARRVLDAACGTGQHSIALARAGYQVLGADLSRRMIELARQNARAAGAEARFVVAGFGELAGVIKESFDALLCLGNSLPHALTADALREALRDFRAVLRPGGLLIVQNLNFDRIWKKRERFMPPETHTDGSGEWIFFRFYDFHAETVTFNVATLRKAGGEWRATVEGTTLRPIFQHELAETLSNVGFVDVEYFGSLGGEPFDPETSGNLVVTARADK